MFGRPSSPPRILVEPAICNGYAILTPEVTEFTGALTAILSGV